MFQTGYNRQKYKSEKAHNRQMQSILMSMLEHM